MSISLIGSNLVAGSSSREVGSFSGSLSAYVWGNFGQKRALVMLFTSGDGVTYVPVAGSTIRDPGMVCFDLAVGAYIRADVIGGDAATSLSIAVAGDAAEFDDSFMRAVSSDNKVTVFSDGLTPVST